MTAPAERHPPDESKPNAAGGRLSRWLLWAAALALGAAVLSKAVREGRQAALLPPGTQAPAFVMEKYGGGTTRLQDLSGKVVILGFWATWCPPCVEEIPILVRLAKQYEGRGLAFVAANRDDASEAKAAAGVFVARRAPALAPYIAFASDQVAIAYKVDIIPTLYILDREGKVADAVRGFSHEDALRSRIEAALSK